MLIEWKPFEDKNTNCLEIFNEFIILLSGFGVICFLNSSPELVLENIATYVVIALCTMNAVVNLGYLAQ